MLSYFVDQDLFDVIALGIDGHRLPVENISQYLPNLSTVANWASVLSFLVSCFVAVAIINVRKQIIGRVQLPTLMSDIDKHASTLAKLLNDYDNNKDEISLAMTKCEASLNNLKKTIKGDAKSKVITLKGKIERYKGSHFINLFGRKPSNIRETAWGIYEDLNGLTEELKYYDERQRLGG